MKAAVKRRHSVESVARLQLGSVLIVGGKFAWASNEVVALMASLKKLEAMMRSWSSSSNSVLKSKEEDEARS